jgi:hypothetical protein
MPKLVLTRCEWSGKVPRRQMWSAMEPDLAVCACGGTWEALSAVGNGAEVFPEHGRGQCFPGHCEAWPTDMSVTLERS